MTTKLNRAVVPHKSDVTRTPGWRLKIARKGAGLSVREVAQLLVEEGVEKNYRTVSGYENDETSITIDVLVALCRIYDASPLWVLIRLGPERWSELPVWLGSPEEFAIQAAVERFAREMAEAGRAAGVAESVAAYWHEAGEAFDGAAE